MADVLPEREFEVEEGDGGGMEMDDRTLVADLIREQGLRLLQKEVPHAMAVVVNQFEQVKDVLKIQADLVVERETQKKIVVGTGGAMVREIGTRARAELERVFEGKLYLELFVKVRAGWRDDPARLKEYGYSD
jgi:GTP-binding protein Era